MFQIEEIDPKYYRKQTRNATLRIMAIFFVFGMIGAVSSVEYLSPYNNNKIVLNLLGAFAGLVVTALIVKTFFKDSPWMKEAMYAWQLKRNLMRITNVMEKVKAAANQNDENAMKVLRFYHLGLEQMHQLEDNNHALIDLVAEMNELKERMASLNIDTNQTQFDWESQLEPFSSEER